MLWPDSLRKTGELEEEECSGNEQRSMVFHCCEAILACHDELSSREWWNCTVGLSLSEMSFVIFPLLLGVRQVSVSSIPYCSILVLCCL